MQRSYTLHLWGDGKRRRDFLTCRCNKDGFYGDSRGWHGDGVIDPQIKHDNEPRSPLFSTVISSASGLDFPSEKREETVKLDKRLKDEFQLFLLVGFFSPLSTCLTRGHFSSCFHSSVPPFCSRIAGCEMSPT